MFSLTDRPRRLAILHKAVEAASSLLRTDVRMIAEYHCASCNETFSESTVEGVLKRAAAHNHDHHGGPDTLTPELEASLRAAITTRD
jgi:Protein of unknown function (DUF1059)